MHLSKKLRRGGALLALAGTGVAVVGSASAYVGEVGTGGPPTSAAPDLISVTITRKVQPSSPLGPQARYCFDESLNQATISNTDFRVVMYDNTSRAGSATATIDTGDTKCAIATFGNGLDISQATVGYILDGAVENVAGNASPEEGAPVTGTGENATDYAAVAGATTAPDLVSVSVNAGASPPQITYTFDEFLDPALAGGGAASAAKFGFYVDTDDGACAAAPCSAAFGRRGASILGVDGKSVVVNFAVDQSVQQAKLFFVDPTGGGTNPGDRTVAPNFGIPTTTSPIGSVGQPITGGPSLISASKQAGSSNQIVDLKFAQAVIPGVAAGNVTAYRADAGIIGGTYVIGTSGADTSVLPVTMPNTTQKDPTSVVRIAIRPGLVRNQANDRSNAFGAAAISTEPVKAGYTDAPDLLTATVDDATNRVTYNFDEALHEAPDPDPTLFRVINADGTTSPGQAGSQVVDASTRKSVSVKFGGSVSGSSIAGVSLTQAAAFDAVTDTPANGNGSQPGSVSLGVIACQPGTCPEPTVTVTPTPTQTQGPTPTPTVDPGQTVNIKTKVTIKRKKNGKRYVGKVKASGPCKAGRSVRLYKGSKRVKNIPSKGNGKYVINVKKAIKKGKARVKVTKRTVQQGNTTFRCSVAKSKKV